MIKLLKKYQIQLTPFNATKDWALDNNANDDLLLFESTGSEDGLPFALEYLDYGDGSDVPYVNSTCSIGLEQQADDLARYEQGLKVNGPFYPETDPKNPDGTYKRPIYHQVKTMFYNTYFDPSKIWGSENIDIEISKTKRLLADNFQLLDIPKNVYGEKILPNTVNMFDDSFDNPLYITDDGNGNLMAGNNIFLRQQELGEFDNQFASGFSTYCDNYFNPPGPPPVTMSVSESAAVVNYSFLGGALNPVQIYASDSPPSSMQMAFFFGNLLTDTPYINTASVTNYMFYSGNLFTTVQTGSSPGDTASVTNYMFLSGSLFNTVITGSSGPDTASVTNYMFYSGSLFNTVITGSSGPDSESLSNYSFYSGGIVQIGFESYGIDTGSFSIAFYSGSIIGTFISSSSSIG